jgi:hypothetical protein
MDRIPRDRARPLAAKTAEAELGVDVDREVLPDEPDPVRELALLLQRPFTERHDQIGGIGVTCRGLGAAPNAPPLPPTPFPEPPGTALKFAYQMRFGAILF